MALKFFKQRDIDEMDASNIPDSFISYFESLSQERKEEIISSRPDLAVGLGYSVIKPEEEKVAVEAENSETNIADVKENESSVINDDEQQDDVAEVEEDIFAQIRVNRYEQEDLDRFFVDGARPLEVLTVPDKTEKCIIHRSKFEKKNIKYKSNHGSTYGLVLNLCRECKRVYQDESHVEHVHQALTDRHIPHTFYDVGLTNLFLRSQQSAYEMGQGEKIYIPDVWVEENPVCPIHDEELYELTCEKTYSGRKVTFTGYFCDRCNKILVRKAHVSDIIDECAMNGIPEIETEPLVKKAPKKKPIPKKEIRPDYFIQDGKRQQYNYSHNADCFKLSEDDTVVISDSIYCSLDGHHTEEVLAMIMVKQKREGRKAYLFMVGYCSECQKYYMDEEDYKVVYALGRPEVTILSDLDGDEYHITSGEVFNLERTHLKDLEDDIDGEITGIHHHPDYVNPFAVGDYDDGNLSFAKSVSKNKYGPRLEELESYQPKPYNYRVDITADGKTETYYVGAADIDLGGGRKVISFNSDFGHELVNYQTIKVKKGGKEYDIKLSRQFDIENATLYGYANLRTDEDIIFRSGVTDPFLVRVLNMRKKQHNLIDIIATIQENQNKIVDANFNRNIIVQGCAGSGKTMVLLHRLSSLQYKNRYFDFSRAALILTPNDQFSLHIKGLAEGLQLGNIDRESVEQYYINMLLKYSDEFKPDTKLVSEMAVRQDFVDYVYSDQFIKDFDVAYEKIIAERNRLTEILDNLTEAMGQPNRTINYEDDTRVIEQIRMGTQAMDSLVKKHNLEVETAKNALEKISARRKFLEEKIPESEKFAAGIVRECLPRVFTKIGTYMSERQTTIDQLREEQQQLLTERQRVQSAILMFGKKGRLEQIDKDIKSVERKINSELKKQEDESAVFSISLEGKTDDEITTWMRQVMLFVKEVQDEVRLCKNSKEDLEKYRAEMNSIADEIIQAQKALGEVAKTEYSPEVMRAIQYLYEKTDEYTLLRTYQMVFDEAVASFKEENRVKSITGKYHRYDLYAELLFAKKFFKSVHGTTQFMCVDEGQDLALNEYRLIAEINQNNVIFNVFGDTNQLMKAGRGISDWSELMRLYNADEYVLNENYRNTNQITRFCNSSFGMNVLQTGVDGVKVREIARKELEAELANSKITSERLAILVPRGVQKKKYLQMDLLPDNISSVIGDEIGNGRISLLYVDEAKGIEFDKVFVVGNKMERNEKYIAYTRALSELVLVVDNTVEDYDDGSGDFKKEQKFHQTSKQAKKKTKNSKGTLTWKEQTAVSEEKTKEKVETEKISNSDTDEEIIERAYDFDGVKKVKCGLIRVPEHMRETDADAEEMAKTIDYFKKYEMLDAPVSVSVHGNKYMLVKGTSQYWAAISLGLTAVEAICMDGEDDDSRSKPGIDSLKREDKTGVSIIGENTFNQMAFDLSGDSLAIAETQHTEQLRFDFSDKKPETELTPAYQKLKSFAGAASKAGEYINGKFSDADIMDALDVVFSSKSKKDTSYKFVFLKAIIDLLDKVDENHRLTFDQLFQRFTEIYWPIVVDYNLRQKVGEEDSQSYIEQILIEAVNTYGIATYTNFTDLTKNQQRDIVKGVKQKCKMNVVGALYGDTKSVIYAFSRKDEWIEINPAVYDCLVRNAKKIQEKNYIAWADFMEKTNFVDEKKSDSKGGSLYLQILRKTFLTGLPVFFMISPVVGQLLKVG